MFKEADLPRPGTGTIACYFLLRPAGRKTRVATRTEKQSVRMWTSKYHAAVGFPFGMNSKITPHHRYRIFFAV